jgi:hypothetical protein
LRRGIDRSRRRWGRLCHQLQDGVADSESLSRGDGVSLVDAGLVDEGAVGGVEVADEAMAVAEHLNGRVTPRNSLVLKLEITRRVTAKNERAPRNFDART